MANKNKLELTKEESLELGKMFENIASNIAQFTADTDIVVGELKAELEVKDGKITGSYIMAIRHMNINQINAKDKKPAFKIIR